MRSAFFAALVLGAAAALASVSTTASAQTGGRAFCMKGANILSGIGDCSFDTYQQCVATASGRLAYCDSNPFFQGYGQPPVERRHHRRHRSH